MKFNPQKSEECDHEIGRQAMGGFPGHEHIHPTGNQFCFNCEKTLTQILQEAIQEGYERGRTECLEQCYGEALAKQKADLRRELRERIEMEINKLPAEVVQWRNPDQYPMSKTTITVDKFQFLQKVKEEIEKI